VIRPWVYRLDGLSQVYQTRPVLQIDDLDILPGEVFVLLGPTGAGKSTLLRLLAGLEAPAAGRLRFREYLLSGSGFPLEARRRITLLFQHPLLLSGTVGSNVALGLRLRGRQRWAAQVREVLERLRLEHLAARSARGLSGGEAQLVALARALVLETDVLLLDEPTNNLDPARVQLAEEAIAASRRRHGTTIVWATHNLFQARRVAQRVALLLDGRLIEVAPPEAFFGSPRDPRTAAFVRGEMVY
jgi:tungstate transport system ATP-binding protein